MPSLWSPTLAAGGYPAGQLDLATSPRALPTQGCGTWSLRGLSPGHTAHGFRAEDTGEAPISSLGPSQAKGPQGDPKASPQLAGPGAPQHHLGPMNPQGGKQDGKDGALGTRSISVNTQTLFFFFTGRRENEE